MSQNDALVTISGNQEDANAAKKQLQGLVDELCLFPREFPIVDKEHQDFIMKYLTKMINKLREEESFCNTTPYSINRVHKYRAYFVTKGNGFPYIPNTSESYEGALEQQLETISIEMDNLTTQQIGNVKIPEESIPRIEEEYLVHIQKNAKGLAIFGTQERINLVMTELGHALGNATIELEMDFATSNLSLSLYN